MTIDKSFIQKYWTYAAIFVLSLVLLLQCNSNSEVQLANSDLKLKVKTHEQNAENFMHIAQVLDNDITKYKDSIAEIKSLNIKKSNEIAHLKKATRAKIAQVRNYDAIDIQGYLQDRYAVIVPILPQGVLMTNPVSILVISDLVESDGASAELKITKDILANEIAISSKKDKINENLEVQVSNMENAVSEMSQANSLLKDITKDVEKQIKKERLNKNVWKIAAIVGGATIIYQGATK